MDLVGKVRTYWRRRPFSLPRRPLFVPLGDYAAARTWRGDVIFLSSRDLGMTPWIALFGTWETNVERLLTQLLRPGMVVVEIGANVGYHTLGMARAVGPMGRIHAFEANPQMAMLLAMTVEASDVARSILLSNVAVSDKGGSVRLIVDPLRSGSGHLAWDGSNARYSESHEVAAVRLDDVLADLPRIDLLRMDIEGSEGLALEGAQHLIRRSPDLRIVMEWDPVQMRVRSDVADVARDLLAHGFHAKVIGPHALQDVGDEALAHLPRCELLLTRGG